MQDFSSWQDHSSECLVNGARGGTVYAMKDVGVDYSDMQSSIIRGPRAKRPSDCTVHSGAGFNVYQSHASRRHCLGKLAPAVICYPTVNVHELIGKTGNGIIKEK
jgi:hypothetical protein